MLLEVMKYFKKRLVSQCQESEASGLQVIIIPVLYLRLGSETMFLLNLSKICSGSSCGVSGTPLFVLVILNTCHTEFHSQRNDYVVYCYVS
jgi:hypothetical protein